jgi:hypothetical protein
MHKPGLFGMNGFMVFLLTCLSVAARAQQPGFLILIDAENKQAFTVRVGDQFFASTGQGHLVLSQLKDSSYKLCVRFPKNNLPEQIFPVVIHQKDLGFQLRGADSSWTLYNWQTKETIRTVNMLDSSRILDKGVRREDGFSRLMASVVNDSSVMYNTYSGNGFSRDTSTIKNLQSTNNPPSPGKAGSVQQNSQPAASLAIAGSEKKVAPSSAAPLKDSVTSIKKSVGLKDSSVATNSQSLPPQGGTNHQLLPPQGGTNPQPVLVTAHPPSINPGVKKLRDVSLKISRKMVFQDIGKDGLTDTITLFVYFETEDSLIKKQIPGLVAAANKPVKSADTTNINKSQALNKPAIKSGEPGCTQLASDEDVSLLRSAILKANAEQDKISAASDAFSMKCFTVSQVRLLTSLFVSDKAKYRLMDAAHGHISNPDHFRELVDMLTDKNFQRKFLVMADKRS